MAKIDLSELGIGSVTAELLQTTKPSGAGSKVARYQYAGEGSEISPVYFQQDTMRIAGERLGVEYTAWIQYEDVTREIDGEDTVVTINEGDKLVIDDVTYHIDSVMNETESEFKDHYELALSKRNQ